ncbi:MAG: retropepsin-like aspartic protease [Bacteroidales bacterium]|nr:retropepsin-like aspartic protease [Bacteroidales bacterium]HOI31186.1 retropepsin-like aspartic protease [Bacteroidales bacterium]
MTGKRFIYLVLLLFAFNITLLAEQTKTKNEHSDWIVIFSDPQPDQQLGFETISDFESLTIPIKRAGKLILLDALADSISGSLILDTGASGLVLNSIYFRDGRPKKGYQTGGITGRVEQISQKTIKSLQFDEVFFENIQADLADLGHLEAARQTKIIGFFGLTMFRGFEVVLNLQQNLIELHRLNSSGNRLNIRPMAKPDLELSMYNHNDVYFVEGRIGNKRYTFCLDTGAEVNVLHNYLPDKILNTITITKRSTLHGSGQKSTEVFYGVMNDFKIGDVSLNGMQTIITNLNAMNDAYGISIDGMLGCAFFEQGVFHFNLKKKQLGIYFYKTDTP